MSTSLESAPAANLALATAAPRGVRFVGFLIDFIPAILLVVFLSFIPIIGPILGGLLLAPYWLLRDVFGRSLGKTLAGERIVGRDGNPAPASARVLRNLPFVIGPAIMVLPVIGYVGIVINMVLVLGESIFLLSQGSRMGDKLAGTTVVKS